MNPVPYTKTLLGPCPDLVKTVSVLSGEIGNPIDPPPGCRFHPRCPRAIDDCRVKDPVLCEVTLEHKVAYKLAGLGAVIHT